MTRYVFVTGGVVSSLGKGLSSASLASLLQLRGFKVRIRKLDPYLNVDPGTMNPFQHGEVFVTDDGAETDLDIIVNEIVVIMNKVAIIAVALVKILPADLEDIKLSWETPIPKAPPSDFCKSITTIRSRAKMMFIIKMKFPITVIYSNFLLYQ